MINLTVKGGSPTTAGTGGSPKIEGGVTNSGTITSTGTGFAGIDLANAEVVNGITNTKTGTISATNGVGILVNSSGQIIFTPGTNFTTGNGPSKVIGGITNDGTIKAQDGIEVMGGSTVTGGIANSGAISADYLGISVSGSTVTGAITNARGGEITISGVPGAGGGIGISVTLGTVGSISNKGTITGTATYSIPGIDVSESTVNGDITNSGKIRSDSTGAIQIVNGGAVNGSVINSGALATTYKNSAGQNLGAGIFLYANGSPGNITRGETIKGSIANSGTIKGGFGVQTFATNSTAPVTIKGGVANSGAIKAAYTGVQIGSSTIDGAVKNSGAIKAVQNGIQLINLKTAPGGTTLGDAGPATVKGGVANSGTITSKAAGYAGVALDGAKVSGGIANALGGAITADKGVGILLSDAGKIIYTSPYPSPGVTYTSLGGPSSVAGGIVNAGAITAKTGIMVTGGSTVAGGIANTGAITGSRAAIDLTGEGAATTINQQGGAINGAILLSKLADTVNVSGGAINGNIVGGGASNTINFNLGAGTFTYGAAYGFSGVGQVNVNSGTVELDGTNSAANPIAVYGTLAGVGTLSSVSVKSGGALAPGPVGGVGALTINGSLAFASGANYSIAINGANASKTNVSGAAKINSGADVTIASGSTLDTGVKYTILTAKGGVTGAFGDPTFTYGVYDVSVTYDAKDAYLGVFFEPLTSLLPPGAPANVIRVADAIDNAILSGASPPAAFQNLFSLTPTQLQSALSQLSGEAANGAQQGAFQFGGSFLSLMLNPYTDNRGGGLGGTGGFGPGLGYAGDEQTPSVIGSAYSALAKAPGPESLFLPHWSLWGTAFGGGEQISGNGSVGSHDTSSSAGGFAAGADYHVSPTGMLGFALAGGATGWSLSGGLGGGRSDVFQAGLYGAQDFGQAYVSGALAIGNYWVTTNRTVTLPGGDSYSANFNAQGYGGRLESGYHIALSPFAFTPYTALQLQAFETPSFSESAASGATAFALNYNSQRATDTRFELGAWADKTMVMPGGDAVKIFGRLAWAHDWQSNPSIQATFIGMPTASFVVDGARQAPDQALVTAGVEWRLAKNWTLMAKLDGEFGAGTTTYYATGRLTYNW